MIVALVPSFNPLMVPGILGASLSLWVLATAYRTRRTRGGRALALLAASVAWWCAFQSLILGVSELEAKLALARLQYVGIALTPLAWLFFALSFTEAAARIPRWVLGLACLPPVATIVIAMTNGAGHELLWTDARLIEPAVTTSLRFDYGVWFLVIRGYSYAALAAATLLLLWYLAQRPGSGRRVIPLVIAPLPALLANLLYLSPIQPVPWIDLTPSGLAAGSALMAWAIFHERALDIAQVARTELMDHLREGVVVIDRVGRITDLNPGAEAILGRTVGDRLSAEYPTDGGQPGDNRTVRVKDWRSGEDCVIEYAVRSLPGRRGKVLVLHDVTERERMERRLRKLADELRSANERLAAVAATDGLTGLASRRSFDAALQHEAERARRHQRPLSLVLIDLDYFKAVNDSWGHAVGDEVLISVGAELRGMVRQTDVAARLGGEEMAILLPETPLSGAFEIAERARSAIERLEHDRRDGTEQFLRVTASFGVAAALPDGGYDPHELYRAADAALYAAKRAGRNRVWGEESRAA